MRIPVVSPQPAMELGEKFGPRPIAEPAKLKLFEAFFANTPPAR